MKKEVNIEKRSIQNSPCWISIRQRPNKKAKYKKKSYKENTGSITLLCRAFCNVFWYMPLLTLRHWSPISCVTSHLISFLCHAWLITCYMFRFLILSDKPTICFAKLSFDTNALFGVINRNNELKNLNSILLYIFDNKIW